MAENPQTNTAPTSSPSASNVLRHYLERLQASVRRSGLLNAFPTRSVKRLDLCRLNAAYPRLAADVLTKLIKSDTSKIQFDLDVSEDGDERSEQSELYAALSTGLLRTAEAFKKETGVRSLWLAYPLFHCVTQDSFGVSKSILAPIFLWPVKIEAPLNVQGRIVISRDEEAGGAKYNKTLDLWITENLGFNPDDPVLDDFAETTLEDLERVVSALYAGLSDPPAVALQDAPQKIPDRETLQKNVRPKVLHAGILGLIQWENQALTYDLETLLKRSEFAGVVNDYLTGRSRAIDEVVERPREKDRFYVTDTDPSQERAVWFTRKGSGLVVHGPPGTGKSQTIVNMVADALAHGQRVLVVCQKKAAIDVVANRLKACGLEDLFCLVHDSESDRSKTILSIKQQIAAVRSKPDDGFTLAKRERMSDEIEKLEKQLGDYSNAVCGRGKFGMSYRDLLAALSRLHHNARKLKADDRLKALFVEKVTDDLDDLQTEIAATAKLWQGTDPRKTPWQHRLKNFSIDPLFRDDVESVLSQLAFENERHLEFVQQHNVGIVIESSPVEFLEHASEWLATVSAALRDTHFDTCAFWLKEAAVKNGVELQSILDRLAKYSERLAHVADESCRTINLDRFGRIDIAIAEKRFDETSAVLELESKWWRVFSRRYYTLHKELKTFIGTPKKLTIPQLRELDAFWESWFKVQVWGLRFAVQVETAKPMEPWFATIAQHFVAVDKSAIAKAMQALQAALERAPIARKVCDQVDLLKNWFNEKYLSSLHRKICKGTDVASDVSSIRGGLNSLEDLQILDTARPLRDGLAKEVLAVLEQAESSDADQSLGERWWACTRLSAYMAWKDLHETHWPILRQMNTQTFEEQRKRLADQLREKRQLEAKSICELWRQRQIECKRSDFNGILVTRGPNSKRLRQVVDLGKSIGLFEFRPCWLTNPNTASQIFPLSEGFFDLVIFDEASQCPVEQAVPSIFRGKRIVVAGDEKQLPPTAFFQSNFSFGDEAETEIDAPSAETEEEVQRQIKSAQQQQALFVKDLLEASKPLLRECLLNVHYRSEHPGLIQFSNHAFYSGQLQIPPSASKGSQAAPLIFIEANGVYDKKKNIAEAQRVIALIREIWMKQGKVPTLGVVTFNEVQRDLIEDLLAHEAGKDETFHARYLAERGRLDGEHDVGFFVKNLESVQGDERDVMIFSTTFGRDPQGRFIRAFGPLNMDGGERRLNVAITRAKRCNYIVTSMPLNEISDKLAGGALQMGASAGGREYLHAYMQYVKAVSGNDKDGYNHVIKLLGQISRSSASVTTGVVEESLFEVEVRETLEKLGHKTEIQVGDAGFRIDIAVVSPNTDGGYILGIECDGKAYHSEWTARARDVWRQEILERRGWKIHRIWSTNWWLDREGEIRKLQARLKTLI